MASIRIDRIYPHPPTRVWRALTEPALLARWLMPNDFAPRTGHRFTFRTDPAPGFDGVVHCEVLELEPGRRMTWSWRGGPLDTRVTFELDEVPGGTRLRMTHTGFHGLRARLVRLILAMGCRTLYGRRLPDLLAGLDGQEPAANCMSVWQRVVATIAAWLPGPGTITTRRLAAAIGVLAATSALVFGLGPYAGLAAVVPDGQLLDTLPRADAGAFLAALGSEGRAQYRTVLALDTVFTLVHGACLWVFLRFPLQRLHEHLAPLAWLAAAATLCDVGENAAIAWLLAEPPSGVGALPMHLTHAKFVLLAAAGSALALAWLGLLAVRLRAWRAARRRSPS